MIDNVPQKDELFLKEVPMDKKNLRLLNDLMSKDFPFNERIPFFIIHSAMKKGALNSVFLASRKYIYGYAIYEYIPRLNWIFVMYLAILPDYRSSGLGKILIERLAELTDRGIILEVEDPSAAKNQEEFSDRTRRIAFYKRNGFHIQPDFTLNLLGCPMRIMANRQLPQTDLLKLFQKLYDRIYRFPLAGLLIKEDT